MQVNEIEVTELKSLMDAGSDFVLIDIRSNGEVARGILPNAEFLPMHLIPLKMHDLLNTRTLFSTVVVAPALIMHVPTWLNKAYTIPSICEEVSLPGLGLVTKLYSLINCKLQVLEACHFKIFRI